MVQKMPHALARLLDEVSDPSVKEIHFFDGALTIVYLGELSNRVSNMADQDALQVIHFVGDAIGYPVSEDKPFISAVLPWNGCFFEAIVPPVHTSASFVISKRTASTKMSFRLV